MDLRWETILPALASGDPFPRVPTLFRGRRYSIVVDRRAITALEAHCRASGELPRGPIFLQTNRSGKPTTASHLSYVVADYLDAAGRDGVDRRRLNAPFALSLIDWGWDAKAVADAFGYKRIRSLREHVTQSRRLRCSIGRWEWLTAKPSDPEVDMGGESRSHLPWSDPGDRRMLRRTSHAQRSRYLFRTTTKAMHATRTY